MKFVTSNRHKFDEISQIMYREGIELEWVQLKYDEIQEDYTEVVSYRSCIDLASRIEGDYFLEDTGLYIHSLKGFPGPYSSYVKGTIDLDGIVRLLADRADRSAYFKTVISLSYDGRVIQFGGILNGSISKQPAGAGGFGYDPIFMPVGEKKRTLAELTLSEKNDISHRGRAISGLVAFLKEKGVH